MESIKNDFEGLIDLSVALHKPIIRDTKLTVEQILDLFAEGKTEDEILRIYPYLTEKHIRAVFDFTRSVFQQFKFISEPPIDKTENAETTLKNSKRSSKKKTVTREKTFTPKTSLAKKLWKFRQEIVASDARLLSMDEIRQEVCNRRGERE
ncbi:MAG: DUF433 domain-containing protein [Candidatus Riflebacteria bacterium]|nr:DUF433 domain-containing protein [Candidatus Riflebacteria bacterium]